MRKHLTYLREMEFLSPQEIYVTGCMTWTDYLICRRSLERPTWGQVIILPGQVGGVWPLSPTPGPTPPPVATNPTPNKTGLYFIYLFFIFFFFIIETRRWGLLFTMMLPWMNRESSVSYRCYSNGIWWHHCDVIPLPSVTSDVMNGIQASWHG